MRHEAPAEVWTVRQAANFLNCHRKTVERRIASGQLTRYGIGRNIRLDADEVRALLVAGGAR
jgi:excisionase family DNA binding protein